MKAVIRRRGEKENCDKEERRRAVARRRAVRVHIDVISKQFSSNYLSSLCSMVILRFYLVGMSTCPIFMETH